MTYNDKTKGQLINELAELRRQIAEFKALETEHKHAGELLQASETRYRRLFETAKDGILILDADTGKITDVNPFLTDMLGYSKDEFLGKKLWEIGPFKDIEISKVAFQELQRREYIRYENLPLESRDGRRIDVEFVSNVYPVDHRKVIQCNIRDITERRRAEEAASQLAAIVESSDDAIIGATMDGIIFSWNSGAERIYGYRAEEVKGRSVSLVIPSDLPDELPQILEKVRRGESIDNYETVRVRKDGRLIAVSLTTSPIKDMSGKIVGISAIVRDITERKEIEKQLRHAQKMEAVGTLAGGISHEFNNIMQAIMGYGALLQDAIDRDSQLRTYVDAILISAQRAAGLTRGLLAYSRKQVAHRKSVPLSEIIKRVVGLLSRFIGEDIDLRVLLSDVELIVNVDSNQIEQALMNLAANAKDSMPNGGTLTIRAEQIAMSDEFIRIHGYGEPGMYALISVKDTGVGMDEKTRGKIFEPFFTTKGVGEGTGLGLSMVYGIVKEHNGYIDVNSVVGKGTTFNIYLPATKADVEKAESAYEPVVRKGTETVLVAEDDTGVRKMIRALLEKSGYEVIEAVDGEDAIGKLRDNRDRIQLLLCDVMMPKKNGVEVYDAMMKINPGIKTLFISGYTDDIIHEKGIFEKGLTFVSKPILPKELLSTVRDVLDK